MANHRKIMFKPSYALIVLASAFALSGNALAFAPGDFSTSSTGSNLTFKPGTIGPSSLAGGVVTFASDGTVITSGPVSFTNAGGVKVEAQLAAKTSKLGVAKAIAKAAFKVLPGVALAAELLTLLNEIAVKPKSTGGYEQTIVGECGAFSFQPTQTQLNSFCSNSGGFSGNYIVRIDLGNKVCKRYAICNSGSEVLLQDSTYNPNTTKVEPVTETQLSDLIATKTGWPTSSKLGEAFKTSVQSGEVAQAEPQAITGPASSPGSKTTTRNADGTSVVTTTTNNYTYQGPNVTITTTTTTQNFDAAGNPVGQPTVTTSEPEPVQAPQPKEIETCGLPGKPKCLIDETGTPETAENKVQPSKTALEQSVTDTKNAIDAAANIQQPAWSFSFQFPTGCSPFNTGIRGVILDVCQYRPVIHDLLSMIWAAATVFALIGMVGRTIREA